MDVKKLIELRKEAEKAVAEMSDGALKVKAFEVILNHLIMAQSKDLTDRERATRRDAVEPEIAATTESAAGRILVLRDENFFKSQKSIGEIREELETHGWHYPATTLSGTLIELVQNRKLRRQKVKEGNKKVYKYTNP